MTLKRYAVVDADGNHLNTIVQDMDNARTDWWPGYGAKLIDMGEEKVDPPPAARPQRPADFGVVDLPNFDPTFGPGDKVDLKTGQVIKAKPQGGGNSGDAVIPDVPMDIP